MKFRRLACNCCKSSDFPSLCKTPAYVMSEVVDNSNVIFLMMSQQGRTSCREPLQVEGAGAGFELRDFPFEREALEPAEPARRAQEILASCWRPTHRLARNDDFSKDESPIGRNRRLLEEGSGFWPRRSDRDADGALRERE